MLFNGCQAFFEGQWVGRKTFTIIEVIYEAVI